MDPALLKAVEDAKAALDAAVTANAAAANTVSNDQQAAAAQQAKVVAAQALLDAANAQTTTDQATLTGTLADIKTAAQAEVTALQALIASLG